MGLFGLLILSVLHRVVYMAYHRFQRIWVREVKWEERYQWVVFNLGYIRFSYHPLHERIQRRRDVS